MPVHLKFSALWDVAESSAFAGTAFVGEEMKRLREVFERLSDKGEILRAALETNGFWGAVVMQDERRGFIAADRIRTYPVFYAQKDGDLYISNDAYWVRESCGLTETDEDAEQEFLMTGYVTGADTLISGMKQIQQGEIVFFQWSEEHRKYMFTSERYYRYLHKIPSEKNEDELLAELDIAMISAFKRLIAVADGRTIAIPLSGGYDSRLVALMLKRLGYENIVAYTYGVKGNPEYEISRQVADCMQIPWHFAEYTNEKWHSVYQSAEFKRYMAYGGNLASLAHCQDWIAVKELIENGVIQANTVFTPGLIANVGAFATQASDTVSNKLSITKALQLIRERHYQSITNSFDSQVTHKISKRIISRLKEVELYTCTLSFCDDFNFAERQAKYINNSVRVYDFFGHNHWTVFWDVDLLDFWVKAPWEYIMHKKLYKRYVSVQSKLFNLFEGHEDIRETPAMTTAQKLAKIGRRLLPYNMYNVIKNRIKSQDMRSYYKNDPMAWYGCWDDRELSARVQRGCDYIINMLSEDYLNSVRTFLQTTKSKL